MTLTLKSKLKAAIAAIVAIIVLDAIWLGLIATPFYAYHMAEVGRLVDGKFDPNLAAALVVYILLALGIVVFVVPATIKSTLRHAFARGALLGLVIYGVYDFTNMATLKSWPLVLALSDTIWGATVCGCASVAAVWVLQASDKN